MLEHTDFSTIKMAGLDIAVLDMQQTADWMIAHAKQRGRNNPFYLTSANGEVLSLCARNQRIQKAFDQADMINADGQPMVFFSRRSKSIPLPERVATTDLFCLVAEKAEQNGVTFYLFGATEEENLQAVKNVQSQHKNLEILGRCHGFLQGEALERKIDEINQLGPDILWLALGVPREQNFIVQYRHRLNNVGMIKTSGGLFNFISGSRRRAPLVMQRIGLEWLWRMLLEPKRLFWRYAITNPHALWVMFK